MKIKLHHWGLSIAMICLFQSSFAKLNIKEDTPVRPIYIDEAKILSGDADFNKLFNSLFYVSSTIAKDNMQDAFRKYADGNASDREISELAQTLNVKNEEEIKELFEKIHLQHILVKQKFSALNINSDVLMKALIMSANSGKLPLFKAKGIDCAFAVMAMFSACLEAYYSCAEGELCELWLSACMAAAFAAAALCGI